MCRMLRTFEMLQTLKQGVAFDKGVMCESASIRSAFLSVIICRKVCPCCRICLIQPGDASRTMWGGQLGLTCGANQNVNTNLRSHSFLWPPCLEWLSRLELLQNQQQQQGFPLFVPKQNTSRRRVKAEREWSEF